MTERVLLSSWKSEAAEHEFRAREEALFRELSGDEWPETITVATRLGPTNVYRWEGEGEPVVFLHGSTGTALSWVPFAQRRAGREMFAVDTIGDVGRSRQEVAVESADDLAEWLAQVLDGLGLDAAHLAGTSYGGFLALNLAVRRPDRVRSLFLIDAAAIAKLQLGKFMLWGMAAMFSSLLPGPIRRFMAKKLRMPALEDKRLLRFALYGQLHHRARMLRPEPLTDEQLRGITQPVFVATAAESEVFRSSEVVARAALVPNAVVEVVEDAGHAVMLSHTDLLAERLHGFLARR